MPEIKIEYFDALSNNIIKVTTDSRGHKIFGNYLKAEYNYDSLGNIIEEFNQSSTDANSFKNSQKYSYSDFDKYGNWRIKKSFEYNEVMGVYEQTGLTERIIEPNLELIKQKENESLQNSGLYMFTGFIPFIFMLVIPSILSFLIVLLSIFWERSQLLTRLIVVFAGASSIIFYVSTATIFYLIFTSYEYPRFGNDWFLKQIPTLAFILLSLLLMSYHKNVKELKKSDAYASSSKIVVFHYYADYSRTIMGKMTFILFIYFVFLFSNISLDNSFFNSIRELIIKHF
jgi:hypothetical protein